MFRPRRRSSWRLCARRLSAGLAFIAYLLTCFGLPLPAVVAKDQSEPYPCMDHPCGCLSAEQCWRHCCCFTPEEKFAWAQAHDVAPPPYAEQPTGHSRSPRCTSCRTCASRASSTCPDAHASCRKHYQAGCQQAAEQAPGQSASPTAKPTGRHWVLGMTALGCRGSGAAWVTTGGAVPPASPLTWQPAWPLAERLPCALRCLPVSFNNPLDRPPRPALT
jgi:hypothetical protein